MSRWMICVVATVLGLAGVARGEIRTETVEYRQGDTVLHGYVAWDDAVEGRRPGVVVFPEWWGLNEYAKGRARELAEAGYVAMAADLYGEGKVVTTPQEAAPLATALRKDVETLRARARAALAQLRTRPNVNPDQVAAIGYCFGGGTALELARSGADLDAVASFHGSLSTPRPAQKGAIKARILVLNGGADPHVSAEEIEAFKEEMRQADADWQINTYGGAKHSFTNPKSDEHKMNGVGYDATADKRSWAAMMRLFDDVFTTPTQSTGAGSTP